MTSNHLGSVVSFAGAEAAGAEFIVTTEKDAVRIRPDLTGPIPIYYLRLEIDIIHGADDFDEAVARLCFGRQSGTLPGGPNRE